MEIELDPSSERFDPLDDRWLDQVTQLVADLRRDLGKVSRRSESQPGLKGADLGSIVIDLEPIILSLGSAGAVTAIARAIKAFITRDRGRSVRARFHSNDKLQEIEVRGSNVEDVERLVVALRQTAESSDSNRAANRSA